MKKKLIPFVLFLFVVAYFTYSNFEQREYEWDMPGYLGSLYEVELVERGNIRDSVYAAIENEATKDEFRKIINSNKASEIFWKSDAAFLQQIPYFSIKHTYNALILVFHEIGFSAPMSVLMPNFIFFFFTGILLWLIFDALFPWWAYFNSLISIAILALPWVRQLGQISSPDLLSVFMLLLFVFGLVRNFSLLFQAVVLLNLVLIRPDFIVFVLTYFAGYFLFHWVRNKTLYWSVVVYSGIIFMVYLGLLKFYNYPGWKDVFYDSFVERRGDLSAIPADFTAEQYFIILKNALLNFKKISLVAVVLLMGIFWRTTKIQVWERIFGVLIFANIYLKLAFFPAPAVPRFFVGYLLLLLIWFLFVWSRQLKMIK